MYTYMLFFFLWSTQTCFRRSNSLLWMWAFFARMSLASQPDTARAEKVSWINPSFATKGTKERGGGGGGGGEEAGASAEGSQSYFPRFFFSSFFFFFSFLFFYFSFFFPWAQSKAAAGAAVCAPPWTPRACGYLWSLLLLLLLPLHPLPPTRLHLFFLSLSFLLLPREDRTAAAGVGAVGAAAAAAAALRLSSFRELPCRSFAHSFEHVWLAEGSSSRSLLLLPVSIFLKGVLSITGDLALKLIVCF